MKQHHNRPRRVIELLVAFYGMSTDHVETELNYYRSCRDDKSPRWHVNEGSFAYYLEQALKCRHFDKIIWE